MATYNVDKMLFEENRVKRCENCGRSIPNDYPGDICPACKDAVLFSQVRDYVRAYDVNEYDVAEKFDIPVKKVKAWIREGRMEYKEFGSAGAMSGSYCSRCGAQVTFGTLCPKCLKLLNGKKTGTVANPLKNVEKGKMRFIDGDEK